MITFHPSARFDRKTALVLLTKEQAGAAAFVSKAKAVSCAVNAVLAARRFEGGKGEILPIVVGKCVRARRIKREKLGLTNALRNGACPF